MSVKSEISKAFNQSAVQYDHVAQVQQEIGERLFERLAYLKIKPARILDLGCGTGFFTRALTKKYPKAQVYGLDLAKAMLLQARNKQSFRCKWSLLAGDMNCLPFASGFFDLIFANQVVHWSSPIYHVFRELNRVMDVNACLMFSTLGPDTFKELKSAWTGANSYAHVNEFPDMHDVGDCLMGEQFLDPVMDMEFLSIHYDTLPILLSALKNQGVRNIHSERNQGLTGKNSWSQFERNYQSLQTIHGKYPLTYEVVYGHAWKGQQQKNGSMVETLIPVDSISRVLL